MFLCRFYKIVSRKVLNSDIYIYVSQRPFLYSYKNCTKINTGNGHEIISLKYETNPKC